MPCTDRFPTTLPVSVRTTLVHSLVLDSAWMGAEIGSFVGNCRAVQVAYHQRDLGGDRRKLGRCFLGSGCYLKVLREPPRDTIRHEMALL